MLGLTDFLFGRCTRQSGLALRGCQNVKGGLRPSSSFDRVRLLLLPVLDHRYISLLTPKLADIASSSRHYDYSTRCIWLCGYDENLRCVYCEKRHALAANKVHAGVWREGKGKYFQQDHSTGPEINPIAFPVVGSCHSPQPRLSAAAFLPPATKRFRYSYFPAITCFRCLRQPFVRLAN